MEYITIPKDIRAKFGLVGDTPISYMCVEDPVKGKLGKLLFRPEELLSRKYKISKKLQIFPPKRIMEHLDCPLEEIHIITDGRGIYLTQGKEKNRISSQLTYKRKTQSGEIDFNKFLEIVSMREPFQLTGRNLIQYRIEGDRKAATKTRVTKSLLSESLSYFRNIKVSSILQSTTDGTVELIQLPNSDSIRVDFEGGQYICLRYFVTLSKLEGGGINYGV